MSDKHCNLCKDGVPIKRYFDGTFKHFDGLMAWTDCAELREQTQAACAAARLEEAKWWHWRLGVADFNDNVFREEAQLHVTELEALLGKPKGGDDQP